MRKFRDLEEALIKVKGSSVGLFLRECSTGGREVIKVNKIGSPPTLGQPASQQGGGEEVNNLAGGAWRGLEE